MFLRERQSLFDTRRRLLADCSLLELRLSWTPHGSAECHLATAGGLTSGIDLALRVVQRYYGHDIAQATADYMEYHGEYFNQRLELPKQAKKQSL